MQTMQQFYEQLAAASERDEYVEALAGLTELPPEELRALEDTVTWTEWGAAD